jgi:Flp pilus assembly protein TadB
MLIAALLAAAVAAGSHPLVIGVAALATFHPGWFLVAAAMWATLQYLQRRRETHPQAADEVAFLHALASELRSGSSLRAGLDAATASAPRLPLEAAARKAAAGLPAAAVAAALSAALPYNGRLAGAAFVLTSETGARAADVFDSLAMRAAEAGELVREQRAATAQARLSALVVGLAPLVFALVLFATGDGAALSEAGAVGLIVAGAGFGLQFAGLGTVWWMLQRAAR